MTRQPWIASAGFDGAFILAPGLVVTLTVLCFPAFFTSHAVSPLIWAVLIVGVDVAHVYSTLYRTYFDPAEFRQRRTLYVLAPLLGWLVFAGFYSLGPMVFWRVLAYLAVFHFIRQQYGFMMLYARKERQFRLLDKAAIYAATLYPLVWWHTHDRSFSWFIPGDFVALSSPALADMALAVTVLIAAVYLAKEVWSLRCGAPFNWPRNLLLAVTALSWWVGIVALNSDLAFTAVNILAHGPPYMALIWLYGRNRASLGPAMSGKRLFSIGFLPLFIGLPILLAYVEEGLWDGLVAADHPALFRLFHFTDIVQDADVLVWLVPFLALPQITHYILDAFIWRLGQPGTPWRQILLRSQQGEFCINN
ncbi:hypothetical protein [Acidisphaera sp. L21]|uniref:hypothetical protein n=1 Tax=Acidisphaera sp. L21 TaxID=1641851 RepID=UPI00131C45F7|nr:hypothetical protein [Acidisphaera sp. L21]